MCGREIFECFLAAGSPWVEAARVPWREPLDKWEPYSPWVCWMRYRWVGEKHPPPGTALDVSYFFKATLITPKTQQLGCLQNRGTKMAFQDGVLCLSQWSEGSKGWLGYTYPVVFQANIYWGEWCLIGMFLGSCHTSRLVFGSLGIGDEILPMAVTCGLR